MTTNPMGEQSATAEDLIISDLQTQVRELKAELETRVQIISNDNALIASLHAQFAGLQTEANAAKREHDTLREQLESYKEQWRRAYEQRTTELEAETARQRAEWFTSHLNDEVHDARDEEREACARVADIEAGEAVDDWTNQNAAKGSHFASKRIAAAIRARGAK